MRLKLQIGSLQADSADVGSADATGQVSQSMPDRQTSTTAIVEDGGS